MAHSLSRPLILPFAWLFGNFSRLCIIKHLSRDLPFLFRSFWVDVSVFLIKRMPRVRVTHDFYAQRRCSLCLGLMSYQTSCCLCGFSYSVWRGGRGGGCGASVWRREKIRISKPVLIKKWQVTYYLIQTEQPEPIKTRCSLLFGEPAWETGTVLAIGASWKLLLDWRSCCCYTQEIFIEKV